MTITSTSFSLRDREAFQNHSVIQSFIENVEFEAWKLSDFSNKLARDGKPLFIGEVL